MRNLTGLIIIVASASFPALISAQFLTRFADPSQQRPDGIVDTRPKPTPTPSVAEKASPPPASASATPIQNFVIQNSQANPTATASGIGTGALAVSEHTPIVRSQVTQATQPTQNSRATTPFQALANFGKKIGVGSAECQEIKSELRRAEHHLSESQSNNERKRARQRIDELKARLAQCRG